MTPELIVFSDFALFKYNTYHIYQLNKTELFSFQHFIVIILFPVALLHFYFTKISRTLAV
jgi:hypothetical protein